MKRDPQLVLDAAIEPARLAEVDIRAAVWSDGWRSPELPELQAAHTAALRDAVVAMRGIMDASGRCPCGPEDVAP